MGNLVDSSLLRSGVRWTSQPVVFHTNTGKNIELSQSNTVATRVKDSGYGVVRTREPVSVGQMFKVTVLKSAQQWSGGLMIGFTRENPENSTIRLLSWLAEHIVHRQLIRITGRNVYYKNEELCRLDFSTDELTEGQSLGMLVTKERTLHWFVDDKWRGAATVDDYPLDVPMWGLADVYGNCKQVKAEICVVSGYNPSAKKRLVELGLLNLSEETGPARLEPAQPQPDQPASKDLLTQLLQEQESLRQLVVRKNEEIQRKGSQLQQLEQDLTRERATVTSVHTENQQLQQRVAQTAMENRQLQEENQQLQLQVTQTDQRQHQSDAEIQLLQQQIAGLRQMVPSSSTADQRPLSSQEVEFWQVSPEEVSIREDEVLGGGAWGYVAKGTFRGTSVAIKRVYPAILQQDTLERIRREIRTMAQIRHPNLVLFIAAVLNEETGPMIVTELLDTSLREAYQANQVGTNKRKVFEDVSSALVYLHRQREPIIHRDVSTANVLLISMPNDTWLAKLSDFGSANLARYATTPGEGAILYTAPEAYPHPPNSPRPPPPQTTKIDVYSFGVVACEVVTRVFPETDRLPGLMATVGRVWSEIHPLISSCISHSPQDRPTMDIVLSQIRQLDMEPST